MDDYFAMNSLAPIDRGPQLEGVSDDLVEGANYALDGVDALRAASLDEILHLPDAGSQFQDMADRVGAIYREFSAATIEGDTGLQSLIHDYDRVWRTLGEDSYTALDQAYTRLGPWRGSAANDAKKYVKRLSGTYQSVQTAITMLEGGVVAAREAITSAREDLTNLGFSLKQTAEAFQKQQEAQSKNAKSKLLADLFAGAVTGMLAVATMGVSEGALVTIQVARAVTAATDTAVPLITDSIETEVSGDNAGSIFDSFSQNVDKMRSAIEDAAVDLATTIHAHANDLPAIPTPPEVSGSDGHFDPDDFETGHTSRGVEQNVRDSDVDIDPDGEVSHHGRKRDG